MKESNFIAMLKMLHWKEEDNYSINTKQFCSKDEKINLMIYSKHKIHVTQKIFLRVDIFYLSTLCECSSYEEAIDYISNLDMNNLPPNGL